jgi:hypothetical protein
LLLLSLGGRKKEERFHYLSISISFSRGSIDFLFCHGMKYSLGQQWAGIAEQANKQTGV